MEMYKKISLILSEEDLADVERELRDRFGVPPAETVRLLRLSLVRALASRARISRVESSVGDAGDRDRLSVSKRELRFVGGESDISVWAMVFGDFPGLRFGGLHTSSKKSKDAPSVGGIGVSMRLARGEDSAETALAVLLSYERYQKELGKDKHEQTEQEKAK